MRPLGSIGMSSRWKTTRLDSPATMPYCGWEWHTPDRIGWARRHRLDLLLCGHTHGGQARFPGIGPVVAPSLYGSKFASGVFWAPPTLMHVSRGLAGTHTIRLRCPPEVTLLTLLSPPDPAAAG